MDIEELAGPRDWADIQQPRAPWEVAYTDDRSVLLFRGSDLLAVAERPRVWRARHRRELHRLGFRPRARPHCVMWEWTVPDDALKCEASQLRNNDVAEPRVMHRLRTGFTRHRLLGERSVVVLRDVFRLTPTELRLCRPADEDDWLDDASPGRATPRSPPQPRVRSATSRVERGRRKPCRTSAL